MQTGTSNVLRFGVFELDLEAHELRKRGVRVKLQDQPFRLLKALLERPGQIVTRQELKGRLWAHDEFVEFDKSLNTAVQKIRQALGDSAESPRFLETVPRRGYRFIAPVEGVAEGDGERSRSAHPALYGAFTLVTAAVVALGAWLLDHKSPKLTAVKRTVRQLTADAGFTALPDITPDGTMVVYSSDRDGGPDLDLWLQDLEGGKPFQLTNQSGDEVHPRFAPDGTRVVYGSYLDGNLYGVSTLGGSPRVIAEDSWQARFSLDGCCLAYTQGRPGRGFTTRSVIAKADGSEPRALEHGLRFLGSGRLWLPNGRWISGGSPGRFRDLDWYLLSKDGSEITPTGAKLFEQLGLAMSRPPAFSPLGWLEPEQAILFSAREGDSVDLWMRPFSLAEGAPPGPPVRFTSGGSHEYDGAASLDGKAVYSSITQNMDLWKLPLEPHSGLASGPPKRMTQGGGAEYGPALSADGSTLAFLSSPSLRSSARSRIQLSRAFPFDPQPLLAEGPGYSRPLIGRQGREIVYQAENENGLQVLSSTVPEATSRIVCSACGVLEAWSPDRRYIIHRGPDEAHQLVAFDVQTGRHRVIAQDATDDPYDVAFSADQRWIAFHLVRGIQFRQVFVARFRVDRATTREDWIPLTASDHYSFRAEWSPDGARVYYFSTQGGPVAIWSQPVDPETRQPQGDPELVYEGDGEYPGFQVDGISNMGLAQMAVAEDFLIFDAIEKRGNVWLSEPVDDE